MIVYLNFCMYKCSCKRQNLSAATVVCVLNVHGFLFNISIIFCFHTIVIQRTLVHIVAMLGVRLLFELELKITWSALT